jgi:hypothetical protein
MPRLDRRIQYAAAAVRSHFRRDVLDRPVKPGDDTDVVVGRPDDHRSDTSIAIKHRLQR